MHEYMNEDLAWLRLQDRQREAQNRRLMASAGRPATKAPLGRLIKRLAAAVSSRGAAVEAPAQEHGDPRPETA